MLIVSHGALSDPGRTHEHNEDRWLADPARGLYLVSDGMGEAISPQIVVDTLPGLLDTALAGIKSLTDPKAADALRSAVAQASRKVHEESQRHEDMLGATLVLAVVRGEHALVAHLGDSRAYRLRDRELERLTRDHSHLERLIALGWINPEEASWRNNGGPTRYMGIATAAEVEVQLVDLRAGDRLLLCSDGLTEMLEDEEITPLLVSPGTPAQACERLVAAANQAGGGDNITVVIVAVS